MSRQNNVLFSARLILRNKRISIVKTQSKTAPVNCDRVLITQCEILEYGRSTFCKVQKKLETRLISTGWGFLPPEKHVIDCFGMFFDEKHHRTAHERPGSFKFWGSGTKIGRGRLWRPENFAILRLPSNDF